MSFKGISEKAYPGVLNAFERPSKGILEVFDGFICKRPIWPYHAFERLVRPWNGLIRLLKPFQGCRRPQTPLENPFKAIKGRLQLFLKAQHLCLLACGDMSGRPSEDHLMAWEGDKYMAP